MYKDSESFCDVFVSLLEQYCPSISDLLKWGIITSSITNENNDEIGFYNLLGVEIYSQVEDIKGFTDELNKHPEYGYRFLIGQYTNGLTVLQVSDLTRLKTLLNLADAKEIYNNCSFLIEIIRAGIIYSFNYLSDTHKNKGSLSRTANERDNVIRNNILFEISSKALTSIGVPSLSFFHTIANKNYEGRENNGVISFCYSFSPSDLSIEFLEPISLMKSDTKLIRKLLEMTDEKLCLIAKCNHNNEEEWINQWLIVGIGKARENNTSFANLSFLGSSCWKMCTENEKLNYDGKTYRISHKNAPDEFAEAQKAERNKIESFFSVIGNEQIDLFYELFKQLSNQQHGTMLVVSSNAKDEAERFCKVNRGIETKPIDLYHVDKDTLLKISSIDGAILIDQNGSCYAIGVILDGRIDSSFVGESGRGARYNSAKLYIHNIKSNAKSNEKHVYHSMAIVFSEDGYINVFTTE